MLIATDTVNNLTDSVSQIISCSGGQNPAPSFTASSNNFTSPPFNVSFTNTSYGYDTYLWSFGDGNTSTLENPAITYQYNGVFTVMLIVTDTASNQTDSVSQTITCSGGQNQTASFTTSSNN